MAAGNFFAIQHFEHEGAAIEYINLSRANEAGINIQLSVICMGMEVQVMPVAGMQKRETQTKRGLSLLRVKAPQVL